MTDPRREEYRTECAAAARRGAILLKWPKIYSLFVSNLNDNVNEQLLGEELLLCGQVSIVKIPTLRGRSLGLALVELRPGAKPHSYIKEFHGRVLLGQRMNVVIDQGAKKFEEAVMNAKFPKRVEKSNGTLKTSPNKRTRTTDSPSYSPASPAHPISSTDGPSPSKPKRPRGNIPMPSRTGRDSTRLSVENDHDTHRSRGDRGFSQNRRDSYGGYDSVPSTHPRSFASDGHRDYRATYQEGRDRYDNRSNFHNQNRLNPEGSHQPWHENYGNPAAYLFRNRNRHDAYSRSDRKSRDSYLDWNRSPPRQMSSAHNQESPNRRDKQLVVGPALATNKNFPRDGKQDQVPVSMDETRPALMVSRVRRGSAPNDLLSVFRNFRPTRATNNGCGIWTVLFDDEEDRNRASSFRWRVRGLPVEVKPSTHVDRRNSNSEPRLDVTRRYERNPRDFGWRNRCTTGGLLGNGSGPTKFPYREQQVTRHDRRQEDHRKSPYLERRTNGQSYSYRGVEDKLSERAANHHHAAGSAEGSTSGQRCSTDNRASKYNMNERRHEDGRNARDGQDLPDRKGKDERRRRDDRYHTDFPRSTDSFRCRLVEEGRKHDGALQEHKHPRDSSPGSDKPLNGTCSTTKGGTARVNNCYSHGNTRKGSVKPISPLVRRGITKGSHAGSALSESSKKLGTPTHGSIEEAQKIAPAEQPKKLSAEDFADILAQHVYRTAKEAIAVRGAVFQKSLVAQTVVKFLTAKRAKENREKKIARQAALAKQKSDMGTSQKEGGASSSTLKTAHLDLVETFLKPAKPKQTKPPLPRRQTEVPSKKRLRKSRFADTRDTEPEHDARPRSSDYEDEEPRSPEDHRGVPVTKRRRLVLSDSPELPHPGHASPDGNRQNSVESVASNELFGEKDAHQLRNGDDSVKPEESVAPQDMILHVDKPQVRHPKASSLKLSSPSPGDGSIPHLVLSLRPPRSPVRSGPVGSTFTTSEDSVSQGSPKSSDVTKKTAPKKGKVVSKSKKKGARSQSRSSKKQCESTTDDEHVASLLLSLNEKIKKPGTCEVVNESGFFDCSNNEYCETKQALPVEKVEDAPKSTEDERDDPDECEPTERVGKCARTDVYVRAEHVRQHQKRNVHSRTSTSTQSSRECRQENRVYRKGVSHINPKNDIISLNHLKQRRKKVSFGQSGIHGMGLYAKEDIDSGEFIIEYVGDLIRRVVADLREKKYTRQGMGDSYLFRLSGDWVVDATRRGGIARYINHSCEPNVIAKIISVVGEPKIVFYSKRSIKEGEELTYDYKFDFEAEDQKIPCLCQAPSCRKYLN